LQRRGERRIDGSEVAIVFGRKGRQRWAVEVGGRQVGRRGDAEKGSEEVVSAQQKRT
jgi:hypothetical protein